MATIAKTTTTVGTSDDRVYSVAWASMANGDTGEAVELPMTRDRSVQVTGTFGAGGTIVIEGSNDGTNYVTLTDLQGNAISKTAAFVEQVQEITQYIRPRVTAGDGTTSLTVTMLMRRGLR